MADKPTPAQLTAYLWQRIATFGAAVSAGLIAADSPQLAQFDVFLRTHEQKKGPMEQAMDYLRAGNMAAYAELVRPHADAIRGVDVRKIKASFAPPAAVAAGAFENSLDQILGG